MKIGTHAGGVLGFSLMPLFTAKYLANGFVFDSPCINVFGLAPEIH